MRDRGIVIVIGIGILGSIAHRERDRYRYGYITIHSDNPYEGKVVSNTGVSCAVVVVVVVENMFLAVVSLGCVCVLWVFTVFVSSLLTLYGCYNKQTSCIRYFILFVFIL